MPPYRTASYGRICIKCGEALEVKRVLQVDLDHCGACGGLWLDADEIKQLAKHPAGALEAIERLVPAQASSRPADRVDVSCPACEGKLVKASAGPLVVEHCFGCGGIFLDHGELKKAMEVFGSEASSIVALAGAVSVSGTVG